MAPNYTNFPNPIQMKTPKAARVLGKLIALWTMDESKRPSDLKSIADGRIFVMSAESFGNVLKNGVDGITLDDSDFELRSDITEVELIVRETGRASFLLPEEDAISGQEQTRNSSMLPGLKMPRVPVGPTEQSAWMAVGGFENETIAQMKFESEDALDRFLYPYMAGYMCSQCT